MKYNDKWAISEFEPKTDVLWVQPSQDEEDESIKINAFVNGKWRAVSNGENYPPEDGIPVTDLDADVQSSLSKADTAYQKPTTGIPASDLASSVQTSLGKADTALQTIKTVNGQSLVGSGDIEILEPGTTETLVIDGTPTAGSSNLITSGGVASEIVWDVTARNSNATFASLSALLSNANLATLIPTDVRKGGMQIRFVLSSDNNYVQFRLLKNTWSADVNDWQSMNVDNLPTDYSQNLVKSGGVKDMLNVSNLSKNKMLAISGLGVRNWNPAVITSVSGETLCYFPVTSGQLVYIKVEGSVTRFNCALSAQKPANGVNVSDFKSAFPPMTSFTAPNDGYVCISAAGITNAYCITAKEDIGSDVYDIQNELNGVLYNGFVLGNVLLFDKTDVYEGDTVVFKTDKTYSTGAIAFYDENDTQLDWFWFGTVTSRERVIPVGFDHCSVLDNPIFDSLLITKASMEERIRANEEAIAGFHTDMPIDWSDSSQLHLPIPRTCAKINLIVDSLPTTKNADYNGYVEYMDFDGNYFKKKMVLNAQGDSSLAYVEKNFTLDIDDDSKIQFGNWVPQDSFHLKAYYIDVFRGTNNICLKWTNKVIEHLGCRSNRILNSPSLVSTENGTGTFTTDFGSPALCQPDGFPIEVYHNGTYHGLYALNLKKNRDNYQMGKSNYTQALLDGRISEGTFFGGSIDWTSFELRNPKKLILVDGVTEYNGDTPSEIIGTDSPNYDSSNTNHVNTATTKTMIQEVADCIATISSMPVSTAEEIQAIKTLFESHYDVEMVKCYFILSNVIYHLDGFSKNWIWTIYNGMAAPNFYDMDTVFGRVWYGSSMWGNNTTTNIIGTNADNVDPAAIISNLYKTELDAMYKDLRDNDYISVSTIMSQMHKWIEAQTLDAIQRNLNKWTAIPSYRANGGSYPPPLSYDAAHQTEGMYDCPARVEKWLTARIASLDNYFNYSN